MRIRKIKKCGGDAPSVVPNSPSPQQAALFVSVIIPAHNEEKYLGRTLEALQSQTYVGFEIIVVANACSDNTEAVARGRCDKCFYLEAKGMSRARNLGGKKAWGELLIFLDADTVMEPEGIEIITREFTRKYAAGTLKGRPDSQKLRYKLMYRGKNLLHWARIHRGSSGIIICWKDYFKAAGGFEETLHLRENSDLIKKLGRFGRYKYIGSTSAFTSMRRYEKAGTLKILWHWFKVWWLSLISDMRDRHYETVR